MCGRSAQGPAWAWLLGPFVLAYLRVDGDPAAARTSLEPLAHHLDDFGVGSIAEIFEGDPPFRSRGCIAQAWSVAETLRAWMETARERARMPATLARPAKAGGSRRQSEH